MFKKIIFSVLILVVSNSLTAQNWWGSSKKINGNGKVVIENRTTATFDAILVGGSFDVVLIKGKEGNIRIEGEENIIPFIETVVSANKLQIKFKENTNINTTKKLLITVNYNKINKVSLGGSGSISNKNVIKSADFSASLGGSGNITLQLETTETNANIGGSGNINLSGKTTDFTCSIAGSGSINAYDLSAKTIQATIAGSGSIETTVSEKIKAKVVGSGNVYYKGNPKNTDIKSVGSGSVIDKN